MKSMKSVVRVVLCLVILVTFGCATSKTVDTNYLAYLEAQKAHVVAQKQEIQLMRMVAKEGESIELKGVKEFSVYMPAPQSKAPEQKTSQPSEWAGVANNLIKVAGHVAGVAIMSEGVVDLVNTVGKNSGHNTIGSYNDQSSGDYRNNTGDGYGNIDSYNTDNSSTDNSSGNYRNFTGDQAGYIDNTNNAISDSYNPDNSITP
jgi:hypothetical protein